MSFKHSRKWYFWASLIAAALGVLFAIIPAVVAILINFPVMVTKNSDSTVSMLFVVALIVPAIVLLYFVIKTLKTNPFLIIVVALLIVTLLLSAVYKMEQQTILGLCNVAATETIGCGFTAVCFGLYKIWHSLYENCGQVYGEVKTK